MRFLPFLMILLLGFTASAKEEIDLMIGFGKVEIVAPSHWSSDRISEVETELLINEELANLVTANNQVSLTVELPSKNLTTALVVGEVLAAAESQIAQAKADEEDFNAAPQSPMVIEEEGKRVVMGTDTEISENEVLEEVVVVAGRVVVRGEVKRLVVLGGSVTVEDGAKITEEFNVIGGVVDVKPGAKITGEHVELNFPLSDQMLQMILRKTWDNSFVNLEWTEGIGFNFFIWLLKSVFFYLVVRFFRFVAPVFYRECGDRVNKETIKSFWFGVLQAFLVLPTAFLLAITVIGIPLLPLHFSMIFLFFILGYALVAISVGSNILAHVKGDETKGIFLVLAIGLLIIQVLGMLPMVGAAIKWGIVLIGFGAVSTVFSGRIFRPRASS